MRVGDVYKYIGPEIKYHEFGYGDIFKITSIVSSDEYFGTNNCPFRTVVLLQNINTKIITHYTEPTFKVYFSSCTIMETE